MMKNGLKGDQVASLFSFMKLLFRCTFSFLNGAVVHIILPITLSKKADATNL